MDAKTDGSRTDADGDPELSCSLVESRITTKSWFCRAFSAQRFLMRFLGLASSSGRGRTTNISPLRGST